MVASTSYFFYRYNFIYLFLAMLSFRCCTGFSLITVSRGYSSLQCEDFLSSDFCCSSWALECRLSSCDAQAQLLGWAVRSSQTRDRTHVSYAGRQFFTTGPPEKSCMSFRIDFSVAAKKNYWNFDRNCIESEDCFG